MKKLLAAVATAALIAVSAAAVIAVLPAQATTFSLRTIYVAAGVFDSGDAVNAGTATSVHCSNVSGKVAQVRVAFYGSAGGLEGSATITVPNLSTHTFSTHGVFYFADTPVNTGSLNQGVLNVSSTESGVVCSAMVVDASGGPDSNVAAGIALHMVRFNPHPGTVE